MNIRKLLMKFLRIVDFYLKYKITFVESQLYYQNKTTEGRIDSKEKVSLYLCTSVVLKKILRKSYFTLALRSRISRQVVRMMPSFSIKVFKAGSNIAQKSP